MRKRILCIITALTLIMTMMPYMAHAETDAVMASQIVSSGTCGDTAVWELDSKGNMIINGAGPIKSFGKELKTNSVKKVTISEGITAVGSWAFNGFNNLTEIKIPGTVTTIKDGAFYGCGKLTSVDIPEGVTTVEDWAFNNCTSLKTVTMADSVVTLGEAAFNSCSRLTSVTLSNNITVINNNTFVGCANLTSISIPKGVTEIGDYAFRNCTKLTKVAIPEGVSVIGDYAFDKCTNLTSITIPESVTIIGNSAFKANDDVAVFGTQNSAAQTYASVNNHEFYYLEHLKCIEDGWTRKPVVIKYAGFGTIGTKQIECTRCGSFNELEIPAAKGPVLSAVAYTFNNKVKKPTVSVHDTEGAKLPISVSYAKGRKNVGKYPVTVTLKNGEYKDKVTTSFVINPREVSISKLYRYKKAFKVKWKRPAYTYRKQMKGYQVCYSTSSDMSDAKTTPVLRAKITSKTIKKLEPKTYYYVKIRTYKKVKGVYYYSGWSKVRKIKTK